MHADANNADSNRSPEGRSLVFCSAGRGISELSWLDGLSGIDVGLVYYGDEPITPPASKFYLPNKDFKVPNFIQLAREFPEVLTYDYYFFVDDDLIFEAACLHAWLGIVIANGLDVSQPSLTTDSKVDWPHLKRQASLKVDLDQFVEVQCFCLSRNALRLALPFFFMAKTGAGLDIAIYLLGKRHRLRSAVIHELAVHHPHRADEQTVRRQFSEFATFNPQLSRFIAFCLDEPDPLDDLARASQTFGDTRYGIVRLLASLRFMMARVQGKLKREVFS